jgi:sugar lactone lactonase YvrE
MAGRSLVVLGPGPRGDTAGELYRVPLDSGPVDVGRLPRIRLPFVDDRMATLGSLVVDARSGDLYLGEENGQRVYRLEPDQRLTLFATGLRRLMGGSTLALDADARLVVVDHIDPRLSPDDELVVPGLEDLREEDYRGPLVFRLLLDRSQTAPRRLALLAPLYPRGWGGKAGGALLPRFVAAAPLRGDGLALLSSTGQLFRLDADGVLRPLATLPAGQYHRVHMVAARDGTLYVSGGFWVGRLYAVAPTGAITRLGDPQGIALGTDGWLYVAESALHRIVRLSVGTNQ